MKDSVKANLIVFLIIAVIAFTISCAFANLTITDDNDSYKLISIEDDSFEPNYIDKVPTIIPKVENNTTNLTNSTDYDIEDTIDNIDYNYNNWSTTYSEDEEYW